MAQVLIQDRGLVAAGCDAGDGTCWNLLEESDALGITDWYHFVRSSPTLIESRSLQVVFFDHNVCLAPRGQRDENSRAKRENLKKQKNRKEYDIGWRMDSVPKNTTLAVQMGCPAPPQGLCCLVLDETSRTVKVAATLEPSAAINLEYLLLVTWYQLVVPCGAMWCPCPPHRSTSIPVDPTEALKVRRTAQREPLFSLDPVDPQNLEKTPQKKVYEPSWLAGTSVGDVMFQADYFLKETSWRSSWRSWDHGAVAQRHGKHTHIHTCNLTQILPWRPCKELALGEYDMPVDASEFAFLREDGHKKK